MAIDYAEKEREFLDSLAEDTGRDLAAWMAAIAATELTDRNAIIDWLRRQGFLFAKASWLERIHNNGGRPIYFDAAARPPGALPAARVDAVAPVPAAAQAASAAAAPVAPPAAPVVPLSQRSNPVVAKEPATPVAAMERTSLAALEGLLADAKAYRPLAQFILREIEKAAPHLVFEADNGFISVKTSGRLAGVLTIAAKELRLGLAWTDHAAPAPFVPAKFTKTHPDIPPRISHMVILTDARQVTPDLIGAVVTAAAQG